MFTKFKMLHRKIPYTKVIILTLLTLTLTLGVKLNNKGVELNEAVSQLQSIRTILNDAWDKANSRLMTTTWVGGASANTTYETETSIWNNIWNQAGHYIQTSGGGGTGTVDVSGTPTAGQLALWVDADTLQGSSSVTGTLQFDAAASLGAAGTTSLYAQPQTITLTGANPTTYADVNVFKVSSPTLVGTNTNQTVTVGSSLEVVGPIKSTNVTAPLLAAIYVPTWNCGTGTKCAGVSVNVPTGATANYAAEFVGGQTIVDAGTANTPSVGFSTGTNTGIYARTGSIFAVSVSGSERMRVSSTGVDVGSASSYGFSSSSDPSAGSDVFIARAAAANPRLGAADSGTPVAQTLSVQNGSGTNIATTTFTVKAPLSTGNAAIGTLKLQAAATAQASGTTAHTAVDHLTIGGGKVITNGHVEASGTAPSISGSCGTSPSIVGTDVAGKLTTGTGSPTSCTLTFAVAWTNAPACHVVNETTANLSRAVSTTTTVVLSGTMVAGDVLAYVCIGRV